MREGNPNYGKWLQMKCNILRIKGDTAALALQENQKK